MIRFINAPVFLDSGSESPTKDNITCIICSTNKYVTHNKQRNSIGLPPFRYAIRG